MPSEMICVTVANQQRHVRLDREWLRRIVRAVLTGERIQDAEISLAFVDDRAIHRINQQFLNHDEATDVISFPLSGPEVQPLEGELVVSAETAKRVARRLGHKVQHELALYVIHGLLHLCGYDDLILQNRRQMRKREKHYVAEFRLQLADRR